MEVFETLSAILDSRKENPNCAFNGYLEDYVSTLDEEDPLKPVLNGLLEKAEGFRVLVDYKFNVNHNLISNQIIRYKDVQKIPEYSFCVPLIIYGLSDAKKSVAIILMKGDTDGYILAKGYYLALTEQGSLLEMSKNNVIALNTGHPMLNLAVSELMDDSQTAGSIQRTLDRAVFKSYAELYDLVKKQALAQQEFIKANVSQHEHKATLIYTAVVQWFLMKKLIYVQTMMNRNLLIEECKGDIKQQRHVAKMNADGVQFLMYSEMWRL